MIGEQFPDNCLRKGLPLGSGRGFDDDFKEPQANCARRHWGRSGANSVLGANRRPMDISADSIPR